MEDMKKYKDGWDWACSETKRKAVELRERAVALRSEARVLERIASELDTIRISDL
jgi:hypothetical protein